MDGWMEKNIMCILKISFIHYMIYFYINFKTQKDTLRIIEAF